MVRALWSLDGVVLGATGDGRRVTASRREPCVRVAWVYAAPVRARGGTRCGVAEREREFGARPISAERPEGDVGRLLGTAGVVSRRSLERRARDRGEAS